MNIKQKIFPASSASFHYFENNITKKINDLGVQNEKIIEENLRLKNDLLALSEGLKVTQKQLEYYSDAILRSFNKKSYFESRCDVFSKLPVATGITRKSQLATAKLMDDLCKILNENKINYWFGYGSLLGAYLRHGPIPWDDDIDICIMREDLQKLQGILKNDKKYQVTVLYDGGEVCIQYRFCLKDKNIPVFIDLGVWDYATEYSEEKESKVKKLRNELMEEVNWDTFPYWLKQWVLVDPESGHISSQEAYINAFDNDEKHIKEEIERIKVLFDKYIEKAKKADIICDKSQSKACLYSFDNLTVKNRRMLYDSDIIFPLRQYEYEWFKVKCPNKTVDFLNYCYSSWPSIPSDASILGNIHFQEELFNNTDIQGAVEDFLYNE